jgi:glycosyltransferase involved in cell wall biosynthesis
LLRALDEAQILNRAIGVKLPPAQDLLLRLKNAHPNRKRWRARYYFDLKYRAALTRAAGRIPCKDDSLLQIGHMFCLPEVFKGRTCISYHDGNLAEKLKSGYGLKGHSARAIDAVLRYEEEVASQMSAIFTFSQYLRQSFISDYHVPAHRVFYVGTGIRAADAPDANTPKDYSIPRILFVGVDFERKGGSELLQAFGRVRKRIPNAELHIVGPHKLMNMPSGVVFHGHLSKADPAQREKLESLFQNASLFVLPSRYEPFGIAPLEAMLYRIPCIVTDAWAFRETVQPGVNGDLVAKGDAEDLADKMIGLLGDADRLAAMGKRGRELVLREYTWKAVAGRFAHALSIIGGTRAHESSNQAKTNLISSDEALPAAEARN